MKNKIATKIKNYLKYFINLNSLTKLYKLLILTS